MEEFKFQYVVDIDMRGIYRALYERYDGIVPEIIVLKRLPGNADILYSHGDGQGSLIYLVKEADSEEILSRLYDEIDFFLENLTHKCGEMPYPVLPHTLINDTVGKYLMCACDIADGLGVGLHPICFTCLPINSGFSANMVTILNQDMEELEMLACIAHELRHAWQHLHHPEWVDDDHYIPPEDDVVAYSRQEAEVDAEAYGLMFVSALYGTDVLRNLAAHDFYDDKYLVSLYRKRMGKIDLALSDEVIERLNELFDIAGQVKRARRKGWQVRSW